MLRAWPVKQQPQKTLVLSSVRDVRVVILRIQCVGPVTSVSTAVHGVVLLGVLRYSVVQCGTAVSIRVLLQYVHSCSMLMFLSVLSLISRRCNSLHVRSFQAKGLLAAVNWRFH